MQQAPQGFHAQQRHTVYHVELLLVAELVLEDAQQAADRVICLLALFKAPDMLPSLQP